jgi:hypothetical protein
VPRPLLKGEGTRGRQRQEEDTLFFKNKKEKKRLFFFHCFTFQRERLNFFIYLRENINKKIEKFQKELNTNRKIQINSWIKKSNLLDIRRISLQKFLQNFLILCFFVREFAQSKVFPCGLIPSKAFKK